MTDARQLAPSAQRNRDAICNALADHWPSEGTVLEIASGSGEHVIEFAAAAPHLSFQPTDPSAPARASIDAWVSEAALLNVHPAMDLNVTAAEWPVADAAMIICINMIHIAPWKATMGLMSGAGRTLKPGGMLWLYGPFIREGVKTANGNLDFDDFLKEKDANFGIRRLESVAMAAAAQDMSAPQVIKMPANNCLVGFTKL